MSRSDFSQKTSDVEERNAVQCGTIDAHRRGFTRCNSESRVGALQYHKPIRCAICVADRTIGGAAAARSMSCGEMTANLAFFAAAGAFCGAARSANEWGNNNDHS
jgi:hypothetical protein